MNNEFAQRLRDRTKRFTIDVILFYKELPKTEEAKIIGKQLLRSSTSVASNYRAVTRGRSDAEFFSKLSIVVEEADETLFWLELLSEASIVKQEKVKPLYTEALEITSIMAKSRKTMKDRMNKLNQKFTNSPIH